VTVSLHLLSLAVIALFGSTGLLSGGIEDSVQIDTVTQFSAALGRETRMCVVVPTTQHLKPERVLYLLHGAGGDHTDWLTLPPAGQELLIGLAAKYNLLIVCPTAGPRSYYVNRVETTTDQAADYIGKELIPFVEEHYKLKQTLTRRYIAGNSMGGHGALYIASLYPGLFSGVGSMSGALDLNAQHWEWIQGNRDDRRMLFETLLGPPSADTANPYPNHSMVNRVGVLEQIIGKHKVNDSNKQRMKLALTCGREDFLFTINNTFVQRLTASKVPHTYRVDTGGHTWEYWEKSLPLVLVDLLGEAK
jgi:S-formylglutathione hydrolase FrmB